MMVLPSSNNELQTEDFFTNPMSPAYLFVRSMGVGRRDSLNAKLRGLSCRPPAVTMMIFAGQLLRRAFGQYGLAALDWALPEAVFPASSNDIAPALQSATPFSPAGRRSPPVADDCLRV